MSEDIRLCMIGAGGHASWNVAPHLHIVHGARVVANCDLNLARARRVAERFGIERSYSDYTEMVEREEPEGVIVCVGPEFHWRAAIDLMERGCHVYTEKPNATSLEESRRVLAAQRRTGKVCMVGYKKRYAPAYVKAKALIDSGEFGPPSLLTVLRTKGYRRDADDPREEYLLPWGCHAVDIVPYLFGRVAELHAYRTPGSTHSYAVGFRFANGSVGTMCISNRAGHIWEEVTAIGGGMVTVRVTNSVFMEAHRSDQPFAAHLPEFCSGAHSGAIEQGFVPELQAFVDAIRNGGEPPSSIAEATHSMAVYDAIQRSAADGGPASVAEL
jgi:predicted dehydrogenase